MADTDTYEQNLGRKSSFTKNDFIRVVGSDNVSYKQPVSDVLYAGGVRYKDFPIGTAFSDFAESCNNGITFSYNRYPTQSSDAPTASDADRCSVVIYKTASDEITISALIFNNTNEPMTYVRRRFGSWGNWVKLPTRAEIDALNSKTAINNSAVSGGTLSGLYVSKVGDVIYLRALYISPSSAISAGTDVTLCTLPEGFRPYATVYFGGTFTNASGHPLGFRGSIKSDGVVRAIFEESVPTSASLFGTITAIYV